MNDGFRNIVVMGLGYIGLPTASMLATKGHTVVGVDVSPEIVNIINSGKIHIVEPDLDILVKSAVNSGRLKAALTPVAADVFILAVPTPFRVTEDNPKAPDISFVETAARTIAPVLREGNLVILESTSPVGTTERVYDIIMELRPELRSLVHVAHCPERVLPGHIIRELVDNDRIIGGIDRAAAEKARDLYRTFCNGVIYLTDSRTAELAKLVENSFRDVNIAFANELSMICDKLGINVWELIDLANRHPRVNILKPGPGVGGHCIAVDPWFVVAAAPNYAKLVKTARQVNDSKPKWVVDKIYAKAKRFKNPVICCLGLAFKANIDDLRESPAVEIVSALADMGCGTILAVEPHIQALPQSLAGRGVKLALLDEAVLMADILVVLVDHDQFMDIGEEVRADKSMIDTRGIWSKK